MRITKKKFWATGIAPYYKTAATYQGPGDIASGAIGFYSGARAYSAAFAAGATAIMDLVDQAGVNPITINILTTGFVDLTSISTWVTANSVSTIRVTKLYDQTGTGNHLTNVTLAQMPALTLLALNGLPGLTFTAARTDRIVSGNITQAQPISYATVAKKTTASAGAFIGSSAGAAPGLCAAVTAWSVSGGTVLSTSVTDAAYHAGQALLNGASSSITADGAAPTTGAAGAGAFSANPISMGRANGLSIDATIMESIVWGADKSANFTALNTQAHAATAYNF